MTKILYSRKEAAQRLSIFVRMLDAAVAMKKINTRRIGSGSGIWWIRYTDHAGKLRREKAGRKSDAKALLEKRRADTLQKRKLPELTAQKPVTFAEICKDALGIRRRQNEHKNNRELQRRIDAMLPEFGTRQAATIRKQDIIRWLQRRATERNWAPATQNRWHMTFSLIFRIAVDNEKLTVNPASRIKQERENNAVIRFMREDEEQRLRGQLTDPVHLSEFEIAVAHGYEAVGAIQSALEGCRSRTLHDHAAADEEQTGASCPWNATALAALRRSRPAAPVDLQTFKPRLFTSASLWSLRKTPGGWWHTLL